MIAAARALAWFGGLVLLAGCGSGADGRLAAYDCLTTDGCARRLVVAHRGYHRDAPENSLAAIRATAEVGADLVELDVRHTADGALVLMHDSSVATTTGGVGEVSALTLAEIQALLLDGGDPGDPESCRVPTFEAALDLARELGLLIYLD
jgi:glycerophosphoryl diester phosphodiesterase